MKLTIKKATTSKVMHIFISDSSSTTGAGLTGLVYNSAGLSAYYIRPGDTGETIITLADIITLGTYVSGGFEEVDSTNMPGVYEFHPPNACLATGADAVLIMLKGASNMAPLPIEIQLDDNIEKDSYDILNSGTYGLAQLVRATTPANTLDVDAAGRVDVSLIEGIDATNQIRDAILSDSTPFAGGNIDATISSRSDFDETTDPVELLDTGGTAGTSAEELVDDVWDELKAGHTTADSFGDYLDDEISSRSSHGDPDPSNYLDAAISPIACPNVP